MSRNLTIGIMFRREYPPERLPNYVQLAEKSGFDELWLAEDCFYAGGIASAATALSHSSTIKVGLGIVPVMTRNVAFMAMEIASLARLYPGRFLPGLGHGVADWMRQIGALPESPLGAMEEIVGALRALLHGGSVTYAGRYVRLDHVQLEFPPREPPPVLLGVRGPKSLALSGRIADGTILAECSSPAYITHAKNIIVQHKPDNRNHRLIVYAMCQVDDDGQAARARLRPQIASYIARERVHVQLEPLGIVPTIKFLLSEGGIEHLRQQMPDEWIDLLGVCGTVDDCTRSLNRLFEAGADGVVLVGAPQQNFEELNRGYQTLVSHFHSQA